jgi:hypothetical protein
MTSTFERTGPRCAAWTASIILSIGTYLAATPLARAHGGSEGPKLHVGYAYKNCYIDLHPELSASQFHSFTRQFADAGAFLSMSGARSLAPGQIGFGLSYNQTFLDDASPEWNNTFSHPGEEHWLGRPALPILQARVGLPRAFEAEAMITGDPQSNWAIVGAALRAPILSESTGAPVSMAARISYSHLLGASELDLDTLAVDGLVSRSFGRFTPYAGLGAFVARGAERTIELTLGSETAFGARATVGMEIALGRFRIAGQGTWASVPILAVMVGGVIGS